MRDRLTKNFFVDEFACPCCGKSEMDHGFMQRLQYIRTVVGHPIYIANGGGYRCARYAKERPGSAHTFGRAADPSVARDQMHGVLSVALYTGMTGIGVKNKDGRWQMHLDDMEGTENRPRPWVWTY